MAFDQLGAPSPQVGSQNLKNFNPYFYSNERKFGYAVKKTLSLMSKSGGGGGGVKRLFGKCPNISPFYFGLPSQTQYINCHAQGTRPLWSLCNAGDLAAVKDSLEKGKDANETNPDHITGLMYAVLSKHHSVVELLLDQPDIDISCKDDYGQTALHYACMENNTRALTRLLEMPGGLDGLNVRSKWGRTPLTKAAWSDSDGCVKILGKII